MQALPPDLPPSALASPPALVAQVATASNPEEIAAPVVQAPVATASVEMPLVATPSLPVSVVALLAEPQREATRAWGLSAGGAGGAGFTYRFNGVDGAGWTVAGSLIRFPVYQDNGLPYLLAGFKRHWILQETDRSRLYQSVGSTFMYNAFPSFNFPFTRGAGGGSQGVHLLGTGYGIQMDLAGGWVLGFEVDFGFAVQWAGGGSETLNSLIIPMPELSLLYEY